jgi:hypothetical protein
MTVEPKELPIEQLKERFLRLVKPAKGYLWHYTSVDVLEFFLKGEIAFTHYKFLNDDEEIECGIRLLKKMAEEENSDLFKNGVVENPYFLLMDLMILICSVYLKMVITYINGDRIHQKAELQLSLIRLCYLNLLELQ